MTKDVENLIERYKTIGARDPINGNEYLEPDHPYTKALIERHQAKIDYDKGKITREEYYKRDEDATLAIDVIKRARKIIDRTKLR